MFESLKSLVYPSLFTRLKAKIFHKSEVTRIRIILFRSLLIFLSLVILTSGVYYLDLSHFATNIIATKPLTLLEDQANLSELLLSSYSNPELGLNAYNILTIFFFAILILQLELTLVWGLLRSWVWRPLSILSKSALALLAQLLLIFPLLILVMIPSLLAHNLESKAKLEIESYHSQLTTEPINNSRILSDPVQIVAQLNTNLPLPILGGGDFTKQSVLLIANLSPTETFYRGIVIPAVISNAKLPNLSVEALLFDSKTILINPSISKQYISQILTSYTLAIWSEANSQFSFVPTQSSKKAPQISFLDADEYNSIQQSKLDTQKKKLESYIASTKSSIVQNNKYITDTQNSLAALESEKVEYNNRVSLLLANCREIYEPTSCDEAERIVSQNQQEYDREIASVKQYLLDAQSIAPVLKVYLSRAQQNYNNFLKYPIIPEFQVGIFDPPNNISIKYESGKDNPRLPLDYYYVLLHELAHYYSNQNNLELPSFLEEGITDYLALLLGQQYAPNTTSRDGYPEELKIAQALSAKIGQEELLQLYFDKSPSRWQSEFSKLCGQDCYSKFVKTGENLTFAPLDDTELRLSLVDQAIAILSTP